MNIIKNKFFQNTAAFRFLKSEAIRKKRDLILIFCGGAITAVLEITGIGLVLPLVYVIVYPDRATSIPVIGDLFVAFSISTQKELTITLSVAIFITIFLKSVYMMKFYSWQAKTFANWKSELSHRIMRLYVFGDFSIHMEKPPSEIIRNLTLSALVFDQYIRQLLYLLIHLTVAAAIAGLVSAVLPTETLIASIALLSASIFAYLFTKDKLRRYSSEENELFQLRSRCINQAIGAIKEAKILGKGNYFLTAFTDLEYRVFARKGYQDRLSAFPPLLLEFVIISCFLGIIVHIVFIDESGDKSLSILGLLAAAMFRLLPVVIRAIGNLNVLSIGKPSLDLLAKELEDNEHRVSEADTKESKEVLDWSTLELRNLSYTYPDGTIALSNISVKIKRKESIGIVGPSGSGKTTLMMILLGLVKPSEGCVLVDEVPLEGAEFIRMWQNNCGFVPQATFLVSGSLATNVAFGEDNPDVKRVEAVLREAHLSDYLDSHQDGIFHEVGEVGIKLSGGEKQRLVIARSLYRSPTVLAFDEATSALDNKSEGFIAENVLNAKSDRTIFCIAHRMSTIVNSDRLIFLEKGALVSVGPYKELIKNCPGFIEIATGKSR